ncbi:MAG: hypothetical protein OXM55_03695 [Bdellovibrionales bacterium]|nr:hypothetical protein [Bdellovibrionales bacterium]
MKVFKLLFLYFLCFTGLLCYGNFNRVTPQWEAVNPNPYLKGQSMYYIVPAEKWNKLPDEIKTDVFKIAPEQMRAFFNVQGLNEKDMIAHYIGSMGHVEEGAIFGTVKMFNEIYIIGALPLGQDVIDSIVAQGMRKAVGFEDIGVDASFYVANATKATMEGTQETVGEIVFLKNNTDYVKATMRDRGLEMDMTASYQNLEFYLAEPIGGGGGGGASIVALISFDVQD